MTKKETKNNSLPQSLVWIADAPLFIDKHQISMFYDAVVRPETSEGVTTLEVTEEKVKNLQGKLALGAKVSPGELLGRFTSLLPNLEVSAEGEGNIEAQKSDSYKMELKLHPIVTPQRQLVQLSFYYLLNHPERIFLVTAKDADWRDPESISEVPRELVFLNLPSQAEAKEKGLPETKLIPTAAEFENGKIELIYAKLKSKDNQDPPRYPDSEETLEKLRKARKEYWQWFDKNYSATKAMIAVEEAASDNGRIRWIDYRVPLTKEGDTLHLHISPAGDYDTGVFAYNFIKRGHKHGLRLIGTLKSEPDMNVLAIYDK